MSTVGLVPPGQYPPFATVTEDDHGAGIIIAAAMGIAFTSSVLVVRVFIRKYVNVGWQLDDTTLAIATVLCWVQSSLVLAACADGLGRSLKLIPVELQGRVQQYIKWEIQAIVASIIEVAIFAAPVWLVWQLQKNLKVKLEIVIWFGSRLLCVSPSSGPQKATCVLSIPANRTCSVIIFTAMRLQTFDEAGFATDPLLQEATYISLTQAELSYSIIAATIPAARTLVTDLITYYNSGGMGSAASTSGSRSNTYQMRTLKSKSSGRRESEHGYLGNAQNQRDNGDADSQELIIRKEAAFQIGREEAYGWARRAVHIPRLE
ncbi:hypothetical protein LTR91_008380 [Friedmanniomyces endolithicus]|uniref:Rhodopsin domain-containing protein n=1 Tax=Friedmanniomyces endolithicus TaxID=329885 RepID=A0AAN6QUZ9_9PEZI|nr:hypothetical protein LTR75_015665 [Friedmanniomyces endolithicus]KAK0840405.1 hypothetical protein LTS02_017213 [Friedmanniomyces endolithicus]KAK0844424.1 hypothetical protein LTR03_008118 [Friedmanniomyces endolithicus]KAK0878149.1 hypothetical protein LTR87_008077 [Friedmanniomyces endolithicus]KAK0887286.1 hypothetical protein LTR02_017370 [Friedmanniomyces endolithicus]